MSNPLPEDVRIQLEAAWADNNRLVLWKIMRHHLRWTLENFYVVQGKDEQVVPFILHNLQRQWLSDLTYQLFVLNLPVRWIKGKPRQIGETTFWANLIHAFIYFSENVRAFLLANGPETVGSLRRMVDLADQQMSLASEKWSLLARPRAPARRQGTIAWAAYSPEIDSFHNPYNKRPLSGGPLMHFQSAKSSKAGVSGTFTIQLTDEIGDDDIPRGGWDKLLPLTDQCTAMQPNTMIVRTGAAYGDDDNKAMTGAYLKRQYDRCHSGASAFEWRFDPWFAFEGYRTPLKPGDTLKIPATAPALRNQFQDEINKVSRIMGEYYHLDQTSGEERESLQAIIGSSLNWMLTEGVIERCEGDFETFHLQYPAEADEMFLARTQLFFPGVEVNKRLHAVMVRDRERPPIEDGQYLTVYHEAKPQTNYVLTGDATSNESGGDPAAAIVWSVPDLRTEAVWLGNDISTTHQAKEWAELGYRYGYREVDLLTGQVEIKRPALLVVEANTYGNSVINTLRTPPLDYTRVWYYEPVQRRKRRGARKGYGFYSDSSNREEAFQLLHRQWQTWTIEDQRVLRQLGQINRNANHKLEAMEGHDDLAICCIEFAHLCEVKGWKRAERWEDQWLDAAQPIPKTTDDEIAILTARHQELMGTSFTPGSEADHELQAVLSRMNGIMSTKRKAVLKADGFHRGRARQECDWRGLYARW